LIINELKEKNEIRSILETPWNISSQSNNLNIFLAEKSLPESDSGRLPAI
jgi:hypothetical protein